jgi:predicted metal-dependent peptidase
MKSKHTALYSGVIMLGESSVEEKVKTAFTDGVNKRYGRAFMDALSDPEHNAVVLHENLHVGLKHLPHHRSKWKENKKLANVAADLVVNSIIKDIEAKDPNLVTLPKCAIYSAQFKDWSFTEIYNFLKDKGGKGEEGEGDGDDQGKGKGNVSHWVAKITAGTLLCELESKFPFLVLKAFKLAQIRLPIKTKIIIQK